LWVQALRSYLRAAEIDDLRRQLGAGASDVAQMLPELHDLFPNLPPPPVADADSARFRLFDSTVRFLGEAARARPMVLVIDDLQAADTPSVLLLGFLARQLADMPLLVVATFRDVDLTPSHPLSLAIDEMAREPGTRILTLSGLTRDAVDRFIFARAGNTPSDRLVATIWRETTGNPLFVGEAIRLLSAEGNLEGVDDVPSLRVAVPASIRAVIARRIGHLDPATAQALGLAAALGPEFSLDILRRIGEYAPDEALGLVEDAIEAGLIVPVAGVLGRYRFYHDLVRETLDDDLSPRRSAAATGASRRAPARAPR
jgi:predicted ATPase